MWHLYALRLIFLKDIGKHKTMYLGFSFPLSGEWEKFGKKRVEDYIPLCGTGNSEKNGSNLKLYETWAQVKTMSS